MPADSPARHLSRATRLQLWVLASLALLLALPSAVGWITNENAAYDVRVPRALQAPSSDAWFGTDPLGRCQWNRALVGAAVSLRVVAGALLLALPVSIVLGAIAGATAGRWQDMIISWFVALLHTVPFFLLVVSVAAIVGPGTKVLPWLVGGVIWAPAARLVRTETIRILHGRFVRTSRAYGASPVQIFIRSLMPLATPPAAVSLFYLVPEIIGIDAILTLFGLGPKPPTPSLGGLVFEGIRRWDSAPWLAGGPCILLITICLGIHFLADRIAEQINLGTAS
jgi:peptide/nickel transport system permease protein